MCCGLDLSTNFIKVTSMSFMNYDFLLDACQHHHELAKHAADLPPVGRSHRRHRFGGRRVHAQSVGAAAAARRVL